MLDGGPGRSPGAAGYGYGAGPPKDPGGTGCGGGHSLREGRRTYDKGQ